MLETTVDVAVHVGYFKAFDMLSQGTYRVRLRAFYVDNLQRKCFVQPYLILDNRFSPSSHMQRLFEAALQPRLHAAVTSSFFVRYCDQDCLLNQIAMFRFSLLDSACRPQPATIEVDLLSLELDEVKDPKVAAAQRETGRSRRGWLRLADYDATGDQRHSRGLQLLRSRSIHRLSLQLRRPQHPGVSRE